MFKSFNLIIVSQTLTFCFWSCLLFNVLHTEDLMSSSAQCIAADTSLMGMYFIWVATKETFDSY